MSTRPLPLAALVAAVTLTATARAATLEPLRAGTELLVDDVNIARRENVVRRIHPALRRPKPVLVADQPWEKGGSVRIYGTTHHDPATGEFRMWYSRQYATSRDGVHWTKPALDVTLVDGRRTNFVLPKGGGAVVIDVLEPDPAKRYKALANETLQVGGFSGYYSADGIHWTRYGADRVIRVGSEIGHVMRDPATRKYFAYIRPYGPKYFPTSVRQKRLGAVVTSDDFVHWSEMKVVLEPDAIDDAWVTEPGQRTEFYAMNGFAYGRSYLGIVPVFRITRIIEQAGPGQSRYDGPMEGQLISSRDGLAWSRMDNRSPILPAGATYDQSIMNVAVAPIVVGDEVWHYYTGINGTHGAPIPPKRITIGLARWRLDGFVSLDAAADEAVVETTPITDRTGLLEVNVRVSPGGRFVAEVLTAAGGPLAGFAADDCTPVIGDEVRAPVRWRGGDRPPPGAFRLRFRYTQASLFSYTLR